MTDPAHDNAHRRLPTIDGAEAQLGAMMARARAAFAVFKSVDQARADEAVRALAWAVYKPEHARELAVLAVDDTGLGNVADKITKKQRKTFGTLRDLLRAKSVGVIEEDKALGLVKIAKPVGIVAALTPSTNPAATPVNKAMMALKGRNAVIIAPSPLGYRTTARTVQFMREELQKTGLPADLVQILPAPVSKQSTQALMEAADLVVATGSQDNVRRAARSGTPAIGVGVGNVPVIVDETADLEAAAARIFASKTFDNATSCSSENAVVILNEVYNEAISAFRRQGGYLCAPAEKARIEETLWQDGRLNRQLIARDAPILARSFGLPKEAEGARVFLVEETGIGPGFPLSGEKLSLVLTVYRAHDFAEAKAIVARILEFQGHGHSCGLHTRIPERAHEMAHDLDVVRVLVNFAHTFGNGGGFDSGLNFSLSMGCGSWQKNAISENLSYRHFLNITHLVLPIPEDKPTEAELFGPHWEKYGQ